ncbi:MAG: cyclic nucleotide-binding protein [Gemmatimonadetes bacterium]|jgi:CRP/FNR family cyclic AMP-dependent transcriptional regulator|nr:cyclic nucleotide-binding protein [Gemmatimonadota bacterium]
MRAETRVTQKEEPAGPTIARLSLVERVALQGYVARATWPAGFQIYERGTAADGVFIVERGRVVLRSRVRAGRGFVPWVATPGETFGAEGLSPNGCYVTDARADEESDTLFLSTLKLRAFIREQPMHAMAVVGQVMAERTMLLEKLRELTTLSVEQRLVTALHRMATHDSFVQEDGRIELGSARYRLLCELVGATRESVSLVLGRLTGEGLVERSGSTLYVTPSAGLFERLDSSGEATLLVEGIADGREPQALV